MSIKKYGTPEEIEESIKRHRENARLRSKKHKDKNRDKINAKAREKAKTPEGMEARRKREKAYRAKNREKFRAKNKRHWDGMSPEKREARLAKTRFAWHNVTAEERQARKGQRSTQTAERLRTDPVFRLLFAARKSVNLGLAGIKKKKSQSANSYLKYFGCSAEELKSYIESQFTPEMSWENHGSIWHLDHIIPLRLGRGDQELLIKLCHFRNLRPLDRAENIRKKDSLPDFWPEGVPFTREELGLAPAAS